MILRDFIKLKENEAEEKELEKEAIKKLIIESKYQTLYNLLADYDNEIESHYFIYLNNLLDEYLIKRRPIQYILGYTYFYNSKFKVTEDVLIPRFDTEILVEEAIKEIRKDQSFFKRVLDIGTGSGAIAISIKKEYKNLDVVASDISIKALEIAKTNAIENKTKIEFIVSDLFENISNENKFDMIVSNPPYIPINDDVNNISEIVYTNEPHLALFAKENGLYYYKQIIKVLPQYLNNKGVAIFEIGYNQAKPLIEYINSLELDYEVKIIKDYNNLDRVIYIKI